MNFLISLRDNVDKIFYPIVAILMKNRKTIRLILVIVGTLSLAVLFAPAFQKKLGSLAWLFLLAILFISPIAKISKSKALNSLMIFRREAGILMGAIAIEHAILYFIKNRVNLSIILNFDFWIKDGKLSNLGFGLVALIIVIPLLVTSNNFSMKILKTRWKTLHRLVYPLLVLIVLHKTLLSHEYFEGFLILFTYGLLKLLSWRGVRIPTANTVNE